MTPRNEQIKAAKELINGKRKILRADCGFGKTITSLYAGKLLLELGFIENIVVVTPSNVTAKFLDTAEKMGMKKPLTCSWARTPKILKSLRVKAGKFLLIVDESHRIKDCSKIRTSAVVRAAKKASYLFLLSATPTQNRPRDLYMQLKLCGVHNMTLDNFKIYFAGGFRLPGKTFITETRPTNVKELKKLLESATIRAKNNKKMTLNFKLHIAKDVNLPLPTFEKTAEYRKNAGNIKCDRFCKMYRDGKVKGKAVIFAHHKEVIEKLSQELNCRTIIGGMGSSKKQAEIDRFLSSDDEFIVISITAGGEGIDINGINTCYFVELTFSPLSDRQAFMRLSRDTKDATIEINYLLLKDEHAYIVQKRKEEYLS